MTRLIFVSVAILLILFLSNCKKQEDKALACESITCLNDGKCSEGKCQCPESYTGPKCADQVSPSEIHISNVIVNRFPEFKGPTTWDDTSKADIYWIIKSYDDTLFVAPYYYQDSDHDVTYDFPLNPYLKITDVYASYSIHLMEFDEGDDDEYMGGLNFSMYNDTNNFPEIINIDKSGDLAFQLKVNYIW